MLCHLRSSRRQFAVVLSLLLLSTGCGGGGQSGPPMGEVTGTITYQGQPVAQANVVFVSQNTGTAPAAAVTDSAGRYRLSVSGEMTGAITGSYQVSIALRAPYDGPIPAGMSIAYAKENFQNQGRPLIPEKYFATSTSGLTANVQPGSNAINFDLQD